MTWGIAASKSVPIVKKTGEGQYWALTRQTNEERGYIEDVSGVPLCIVVHLVSLSRLILNDIEEDVDCTIRILRCRTITCWDNHVRS